jgi:hypothetical protein
LVPRFIRRFFFAEFRGRQTRFNVRCVDGVDLSSIEVRPFDGANWEVAAKAYYERLE